MMKVLNSPEEVVELTRQAKYERLPDGRPKVPDELLMRMKKVSTEEAWSVLRDHGYNLQFEANWIRTHPDKILVGRALTAVMVPYRPDLNDLVEESKQEHGIEGGQNSWVIELLGPGDVMVVDLFGKIKNGTFVGDNLSTSVQTRTKAGAVIHGGIRDYQGIVKLPELAIYCRGLDPSAIADTTLLGINTPIRIGEVTVLPGDIVLGTPTGVIFIPPHLALEVVERSEDIQSRDVFGKLRLSEGKYTSGEIDVSVWKSEIEKDYQGWLKNR